MDSAIYSAMDAPRSLGKDSAMDMPGSLGNDSARVGGGGGGSATPLPPMTKNLQFGGMPETLRKRKRNGSKSTRQSKMEAGTPFWVFGGRGEPAPTHRPPTRMLLGTTMARLPTLAKAETSRITRITEAKRKQNGSKTEAPWKLGNGLTAIGVSDHDVSPA